MNMQCDNYVYAKWRVTNNLLTDQDTFEHTTHDISCLKVCMAARSDRHFFMNVMRKVTNQNDDELLIRCLVY